MQGRHLGEGAGRVYGPQGFTILVFFPVNCIFESVAAAKTIRYADLDPQGSLRP